MLVLLFDAADSSVLNIKLRLHLFHLLMTLLDHFVNLSLKLLLFLRYYLVITLNNTCYTLNFLFTSYFSSFFRLLIFLTNELGGSRNYLIFKSNSPIFSITYSNKCLIFSLFTLDAPLLILSIWWFWWFPNRTQWEQTY